MALQLRCCLGHEHPTWECQGSSPSSALDSSFMLMHTWGAGEAQAFGSLLTPSIHLLLRSELQWCPMVFPRNSLAHSFSHSVSLPECRGQYPIYLPNYNPSVSSYYFHLCGKPGLSCPSDQTNSYILKSDEASTSLVKRSVPSPVKAQLP